MDSARSWAQDGLPKDLVELLADEFATEAVRDCKAHLRFILGFRRLEIGDFKGALDAFKASPHEDLRKTTRSLRLAASLLGVGETDAAVDERVDPALLGETFDAGAWATVYACVANEPGRKRVAEKAKAWKRGHPRSPDLAQLEALEAAHGGKPVSAPAPVDPTIAAIVDLLPRLRRAAGPANLEGVRKRTESLLDLHPDDILALYHCICLSLLEPDVGEQKRWARRARQLARRYAIGLPQLRLLRHTAPSR